MPYATAQRRKFYENQTKFVHYTSAEAALGIISSKRLWMRNTTCMSDYREVQHGFAMVNKFFSDKSKKEAFDRNIDACYAGSSAEAINLFNSWWQDIQLNTYIASISEHDQTEDLHGRLSMWRAFGGNTAGRVAIVFNIPPYSPAGMALNLMFSPVAYLTEEEVDQEIFNVLQKVTDNCDFLRTVDRQRFTAMIFNMLLAGVVCLKHRGFHEEREWRVIYAPRRFPSPLIESATRIIGGVPQIIHKIPLDERVSPVVADLDVRQLFDRLIIGPSPYPWVMGEAFIEALSKIGIPNPASKVFASDIPIRA